MVIVFSIGIAWEWVKIKPDLICPVCDHILQRFEGLLRIFVVQCVIGIVQSALDMICTDIACGVAAAVVLLLRRAKRRRPAPYLTLYNYD